MVKIDFNGKHFELSPGPVPCTVLCAAKIPENNITLPQNFLNTTNV